MYRLLRIPLSVLAILALLTSSMGVLRLQYTDPDAWPEAVSHDKDGMPFASAAASHDDHSDHDDAKHPYCVHCNHGCHMCNHLLMHLNSFSAIPAILFFATKVAAILATPAPSLLAETFFKPPR